MNGLDFKKELQGLIDGDIIVENDANAAVSLVTTKTFLLGGAV